MLEKVFEPIMIGAMQVKNRFVMPPMVVQYVNEDGTANERLIAYLEERAKGGWGLTTKDSRHIAKLLEQQALMPCM